MKNLPEKASDRAIWGEVINETHPSGYKRGWRIFSDKWTICEICSTTPEATAMDIARAITEARDIGFQQGIESVRKALNIE
jgi:hypothetical protein